MREWFICPECKAINNVIWDDNQNSRILSCIVCYRTVCHAEFCTCKPIPMTKISSGEKDDDGNIIMIDIFIIHDHGFKGLVNKGKGFNSHEEAIKNK